MPESLHWIDWLVVVLSLLISLAIGLVFTRVASKNIESFFLSGRTLTWFVAGISMVASGFASDSPLWVSTLIRRYGIYYIWQWWAPFIGAALAVVLFARLWRRMAVVTDIEFLEIRYSGRAASTLRFWEGATHALLFCPLIIGWVTKAMEVVTREAMGLTPEYRIWTTVAVVVLAVIMCVFSGLFGVVYASLFQFLIAFVGTIILAGYAVHEVGGFSEMVIKLSALDDWPGNKLNIVPSIGSGSSQMSIWNAIGYFGILWWIVAVMGRHQAQRLLACKDVRHATLATLLFGIVHRCIICWPWIIVGACSLIVLPDLGGGGLEDSAYPRMIVTLLPIGLRGLMVAALISAFISTVGALFNWGSSYMVNDIYKRFLVRDASSKHYILIARFVTVLLAVMGGIISFYAEDILSLTTAAYVIWSGIIVVSVMRWFWWRLNAVGDLAGIITVWILAPLMLFAKVFDGQFRIILRWLGMDESLNLSSSMELLGARMIIATLVTTFVAVIVSLLTKPTPQEHLSKFVMRAKPFRVFWEPVIKKMDCEYVEHESLMRTFVSWLIACVAMCAMIFGMGKLLFGAPMLGVMLLLVSAFTLWITIRRVNQDFADETKFSEVQEMKLDIRP